VLWNHGMTTVGYAIIANKDKKTGDARTLAGYSYQFPDFRGIEPEDPMVVAQVPTERAGGLATAELIAAVIAIITQSPCELECWTKWSQAVGVCNAYHDEQTQLCDELYGGDDGDPEQWTTCMEDADKDLANCRKAALNRHKLCIALCKNVVGEVEAEQPEAEQGGGSASTKP
ncbi:MAG: hypothetical protein JXQ75_11345, partial [Phycisphaerae bacterium]|nr:hypothetical protein [Phycisphaerae bacterium]